MSAAVKPALPSTQCYQRRRPERTLWYRTVQAHFATWLALAAGPDDDAPPAHHMLLALTTDPSVAIVSNMKTAVLLLEERRDIAEDRFVELVVWQVTRPVRASKHLFKYRLAFVINGLCVLRYDNEAGKGDHRHVGAAESPYTFPRQNSSTPISWQT